jgi:hypothetical protein
MELEISAGRTAAPEQPRAAAVIAAMSGHASLAEPAPLLSIERPERMSAVSFLYHDVVKQRGYDFQGCRGIGAARYRLECEQFECDISPASTGFSVKNP